MVAGGLPVEAGDIVRCGYGTRVGLHSHIHLCHSHFLTDRQLYISS